MLLNQMTENDTFAINEINEKTNRETLFQIVSLNKESPNQIVVQEVGNQRLHIFPKNTTVKLNQTKTTLNDAKLGEHFLLEGKTYTKINSRHTNYPEAIAYVDHSDFDIHYNFNHNTTIQKIHSNPHTL